MTDPTITTTTLPVSRVARAVPVPQQVQRLPHGSVIVSTPPAPAPAPAQAVDAMPAATLPEPQAAPAPAPQLEDKPKRARRLRVPVDVAEPAPALVLEARSADAVLAEIRKLLELPAEAEPAHVLNAVGSVVRAANTLWLEIKRDGYIPAHLTFPQRFKLAYELLDGCDTPETRSRLLDAVAVGHGFPILGDV